MKKKNKPKQKINQEKNPKTKKPKQNETKSPRKEENQKPKLKKIIIKGKKEKTFCHRLFLNPIINLSNNKFQSCMNAAMFFHIDFPEFIAR